MRALTHHGWLSCRADCEHLAPDADELGARPAPDVVGDLVGKSSRRADLRGIVVLLP